MKVALFGTALLACAIPASGQVAPRLQPSPSVTPGTCEAALVSPGVPSAVVVLTVPTPRMPAGDVIGAPALAPRSRLPPAYPGIVSTPSTRPAGVVSGGTASGIGSIGIGGVGSMSTSGVGSIGTGGIGSMTTSGIGSIGMPAVNNSSLGIPPSPSSPFAAPLIQSPVLVAPSPRAHAIARPHPANVQRVPFFCP